MVTRPLAVSALALVVSAATSTAAMAHHTLATDQAGTTPARIRCGEVASKAGQGVHITSAALSANTWTTPGQFGRAGQTVSRSVCRVEGLIDGDIGFEIWLPTEGWNGRFLGTGVGGNAGYLNYTDMARGVEEGFAAASTDTGHAADDVTWVSDPRKSRNYANLAHNRLAEVSQAVVHGFYGANAHHRYFVGCSGGGRQALKAMQDFPADYDGILIGAPGYDLAGLSARHLMASLHAVRDPLAAIDRSTWDRIGAAAIKACDEDDGLADGIVTEPARCGFDPVVMGCDTDPSEGCLTGPQLAAIKAIMAPVRVGDRAIDQGIWPGTTPRPGPPPALAVSIFGLLAHGTSNWDPASFDLERDLPAAMAAMPDMAADRTDVRAFAERGGRAILYHGMSDPSTSPQLSIRYYEQAMKDSGPQAGDFMRLYLPAGVLHCMGGAGADHYGGAGDRQTPYEPSQNLLAALVAWVETDKAPDVLTAAHRSEGQVSFTRPLCPYPQVPLYDAEGDPALASSFSCRVPSRD